MTSLLNKTSKGVRALLIAVLILIGCGSLFTKDKPEKSETPTFKSDVKLVNVFASVRDNKGAFRNDLLKEDFSLREDGKKASIENFSTEADLPLAIGVIIDFSPSMQGAITQLQVASRAFFKKLLRPGKDQLFIMKFRDIIASGKTMTFNGQIELFQDLTSKPLVIDKAVNAIGGDVYFGDFWDAQFDTMLADSVVYANTKKMMLLPPQTRKALIVMGDGYHVGNRLDMAALSALEADTQIFTIHIYDPNFGTGRMVGDGTEGSTAQGGFGDFGALGKKNNMGLSGQSSFFKPGADGYYNFNIPGQTNWAVYGQNLQALSGKTGGTYFEYGGQKSLEDIYGEIEEELRSYYSLGFYPLPSGNKGCRKIKVEVKDGFSVHARESYCPSGTTSGKSGNSKKSASK